MKKLLSFIASVLVISLLAPLLLIIPVAASPIPWVINDDGKYYSARQDGSSVTLAEGVTCRGIDISVHNDIIDWEKIHEQYLAGTISFVIIRCGYGQDYEDQDDRLWKTNADACTKYGIPFGAYLYSYATTLESARSEAKHALRLLEGYDLSYPIYYDVEDTKTQSKLGGEFFAQICDIFCGTMLEHGYETGIYSMRSWIEDDNYLGLVDCDAKHYSRWVAEFGPRLNYDKSYDIWQCTSTGVVSGVSSPSNANYPNGRCDINFSYIEPRTTDHLYLTFNLNGETGDIPAPIHAKRGEKYGALPSIESTDGKPFGGWYTEPIGGQRITSDTIASIGGKQILYAHWYQEVEIELENAVPVSGELKQSVTEIAPFTPVTIQASDGYYLPERLELPDGLIWTRNTKTTATISGAPKKELIFRISAIPNDTHEAPIAKDYISTPADNELNNGMITGLTSDLEVSVLGNWLKVSDDNAKNGLKDIAPGIYEIRRAANGEMKASTSTFIKVGERAATPDESEFSITQPKISSPEGSVVLPDTQYQYSLDGGNTYVDASSKTISNISSWTKILIRKAAYDDYVESHAIEINIVPILLDGFINFSRQQLLTRTDRKSFLLNGMEVKSDDLGVVELPEEMIGKTVTLELAENHGKPQSAIINLTIPARPSAPNCISVSDETIFGKSDGSITGYNKEMQYSADGGKTWSSITDTILSDGLTFEYDHEYLFRYKSVSIGKEAFASEPLVARINSGRKLKVVYKAESFDDIVFDVAYGEKITVPELPEFKYCKMEDSYWDRDITDLEITEDITINAVYAKTFCSYLPFMFTLILFTVSISGLALVIFKKRY